jgi:hypothetical protein
LRHLLLPVFLFFFLQPAEGQEDFASLVEKEYGNNQELVNGVQYYNRYLAYQGHPYFLDEDLVRGSVTIGGQVFGNQSVRYNIYSQCVELSYSHFTGGNNQIELVSAHLDGFTLGAFHFSSLGEEEGAGGLFYQEISTGNFTCYIGWQKQIRALNNNTSYSGEFTDPSRSYLLRIDGALHPYRGRREFAGLFPESQRKGLIRLLRKRGTSFRFDHPLELEEHLRAASDFITKSGER